MYTPLVMSKRTTFLRLDAIRIALALAVAGVALALVACEETLPTPSSESTPPFVSPAQGTPTPTPTPGPIQATHWAQIEFKQRVIDAHVLNLLQTNNVMIWRAYMANGDYKRTKGLQGLVDLNLLARLDPATHRSVFDSAVFLTEAQEDSAYTFSQVASGALPDYANAFMDRKGVQQVKTNTEARREVAEILAAYGRAKAALERAKNGAPHIYALIVYGKEQGLRRMGSDESVREFAMVPIGSYPTWVRPSQDFLDNDGVSGSSDTPVDEDGKALFDLLDGDAIYARLEALASIPTPTPEPWPTSTPTPTVTPSPTPTPTP